MDKNAKTWGLVSVLLAVLVVCVVASRILINNTETEQNEILSVEKDQKQNRTGVSSDDLMTRLQQMENQIANNESNADDDVSSSSSKEIELLQKQLDLLTQQVTELTKAVAHAGMTETPKAIDGMRQLKEAANNPVMRNKYALFLADQSKEKHQLINRYFQEEEIDESWAVESEDNIKTNFYKNNALVGVDLTSIDCRTSMCRLSVSMPKVDVSGPDTAAEQFVLENEVLASFARDMPRASMRSVPDGRGGEKYEIILYREGYEQPGVQNPLAGKSMAEMIDYIERY
ncbi:MAG: hypothetical protein M8357_02770 [Desulfobulbaceae bacterium]|nr:hypothetical protein [Desulfobulbaceae bacterium]